MSDIKRARHELHLIAARLKEISSDAAKLADEIEQVVNEKMYRPRPIRRAPVRSAALTPSKREEIRSLYEATDLSFADIAGRANVNPGRVSEVLRGER